MDLEMAEAVVAARDLQFVLEHLLNGRRITEVDFQELAEYGMEGVLAEFPDWYR